MPGEPTLTTRPAALVGRPADVTTAAPERGAATSFLLYWLPALAFAGVIFYMSSGPAPAFASLFTYEDKFLHFGEYGTYGVLLIRALVGTASQKNVAMAFRLGIAGAWLTGAADEFYQSSVPGRSSDVLDLATDMMAVLVAAGIVWLVRRQLARRGAQRAVTAAD